MLVLVLFYVVLLAAAATKSATFDEPGHATAGLSYWLTSDYRLNPENGLLPQRWFGLALLGARTGFPDAGQEAWRLADTWRLADQWLYRSGQDASGILWRGRAAAGVFAVALGAMVWLWSRRLFGPAGGMISLLLYVLNPNVLAHGALMTSDLAGTLFFLIFLWCFHRLLEAMTPGRVVLSAVALGLLALSKMSAVLALPMMLLLAALRLLDRRPLLLGVARIVSGGWRQAGVLAGVAAVQVPIVLATIWAGYGFRFAAHPSGDPAQSHFPLPWEVVLGQSEAATSTPPAVTGTARQGPPPSLTVRAITFARRHRLVPEACLYGYAHVWRFSRHRGGFLNGQIHLSGSPWFFPYAFAVKTPLAGLGLFLLAAAGLVLAWRQPGSPASDRSPPIARSWSTADVSPLLVLIAVYGCAAIVSDLNIGLRHLLPVFPALFILGGAAAWWFSTGAGTRVAATLCFLLALLLVEMAAWFPHYLAYFNGLVRPSAAYRHLVDSSLDWGQDLPALRQQLARRPAGEVPFLAYFGTASPAGHGIRARQVYSFPLSDYGESPLLKIVPGPRDVATLVGVLQQFPEYDPRLVYNVEVEGQPATLLVKRAVALQLSAGRYWISASLVQPVHYPQAGGAWNPRHEEAYQRLRGLAAPLLSDDRATRVAALQQISPTAWERIIRDFAEYRFARLTAWLRQREPDGHVNYSILAYQLTAADLAAALEGPAPP